MLADGDPGGHIAHRGERPLDAQSFGVSKSLPVSIEEAREKHPPRR
jgi:hypothetical protein